jgi:hypothetical protein
VRYIGGQKNLFKSGRADAKVSLAELSDLPDLYALGPVAGLDGEITVLSSQPHVSQVRGGANGLQRYREQCTLLKIDLRRKGKSWKSPIQ